MRLKKITLAAFILLAILAIGAVSAADNDMNSENLTASEEQKLEYSVDESEEVLNDPPEGIVMVDSFGNLKTLIESASSGDNITLDYDYDNYDDAGDITIPDSVTVDGQGHIINAKGKFGKIWIGANVTLKNIVFKNLNSDTAAVSLLYSPNCTFENNTFENCSSGNEGGAIGASDSPYFTLKNCRFENCSAGSGGAVCIVNCDNSYMDNNTFLNCEANAHGGAIYLQCDETSILNCKFENCTSLGTDLIGGAIIWNGDDGVVDNCEFINCSSDQAGSISWYGKDGIIRNSVFKHSTATSDGGAIQVENSNNFYLNNNKFSDCYAYSTAGAIRINECNGTEISDCQFENCTSEGNGGAILLFNPNTTCLNNNRFFKCYSYDGGAIDLSGNDTNISNCQFENCSSEDMGGAIKVVSSYELYLDNNTFTNCSTPRGSSSAGGALYMEYTNGTILNCKFDNCYGDTGGAIYMDDYTRTDILNSTFYNCSGDTQGGAVYIIDGTGTDVLNCKFENCTTEGNGGAITVMSSIGLYLDNNTFSNCTASEAGAIYIESTNGAEILNCKFDNCYSGEVGAIVAENIINLLLDNDTFTNCHSVYDGGAVFVDSDSAHVLNCKFENCTTDTLHDAGALYWNGDNGVLDGCEFTECSGYNGGSVSWNRDDGTIQNCTFKYSTATNNGGAVYWIGERGLIQTSTFIGSSAMNGGAIYIEPYYGVDTEITTSYFENNTAIEKGDSVYSGTVSECNFTGNGTSLYPSISTTTIEINGPGFYNGQIINITIIVVNQDGQLTNGTANFFVNNVSYSNVTIGEEFEYGPLATGNYTFKAVFAGNGDIYGSQTNMTLNVSDKIDPQINVTCSNIIYGENATVCVFVPNATGNITVTVNGKTDSYTFENGLCNISVSGLSAGNHTVSVTYPGDFRYNEGSNNTSVIRVEKANSLISVDDAIMTYGNLTQISVSTINATGITASIDDGDAIVSVNGFDITISNINAGNYTLTVTTVTDSNHTNVTTTADVTILKANSTMNVTFNQASYKYGEDVKISIGIGDATGNVTTYLDNTIFNSTIISNSSEKLLINLPRLIAGTHNIYIEYKGNRNYRESSKNTTLVIAPASTIITIETADIDYGDVATINVNIQSETNASVYGSINLEIGNISMNCSIIDGKCNVEIPDLDAGTHNITATYSGNDNFTGISNSSAIKVRKVDSSISVSDTVNMTYGEPCFVSINVTNADSFNADIDSDKAIINVEEHGITISNIDAGNYTLILTTVPDANHNAVTKNVTVRVASANSTINFTLNQSSYKYGEHVGISIDLGPASGDLTISLDNTIIGTIPYDSSLFANITGDLQINMGRLSAGSHNIYLEYAGNGNYRESSRNITLYIDKANTTITMETEDITYGENATVNVILQSETNVGMANEIITVKIDSNIIFAGALGNGTLSVKIPNLNAGIYSITTTYGGNDNFTGSSVSGTITVSARPTEISVVTNAIDLKVNDEFEVNTTLTPADAGNLTYTSSNSSVAIFAGGKIKAIGKGTAVITVSFNGNDNYAAAASKTINVTVSLIDTNLYVNNSTLELLVGDTFDIDALTIPDGLNVTYIPDNSGVVSVDGNGVVTALKEGNATIIVRIGGDGVYAESSINVTVTARKANTTLDVSPAFVSYGENARINVTLTSGTEFIAAAVIDFEVNNETFHYTTDQYGFCSAVIPILTAGNHTVTVRYNGDSYFNGVSEETLVAVMPAETAINFGFEQDSYKYGDDIKISVDIGNTTGTFKIKIYMDSVLIKTKSIGNDPYSNTSSLPTFDEWINLGRPNAGTHNVYIEFTGNENYIASPINTTLTVNKANTTLTMETADITYGENVIVNVTLQSETNVNMTNETIIVTSYLNGTTMLAGSLENGARSMKIPNLNAETYNITAIYSGNDNFTGSSVSRIITVSARPTEISVVTNAIDLKVNDELEVNTTLTPADAGNLTCTSSNTSVAIVVGGKIKAIGKGTAVITVSFEGNDNYAAAESKTINVTVSLIDTNLNVNNSTLELLVGDTFDIDALTIPDGLNVTYIPDNSGVVSVNGNGVITALKEGNATIIVKIGGEGVYAESSINVTVTARKANATLDVSQAFVSYGENARINVTLTSKTGYIAAAVIDFETDAGTLHYTTDEYGFCSAVIPILTAGNHTVTVRYNGDSYFNGVSEETLVAVMPAETAINFGFNQDSYKYGDDIKISVDIGNTTGTFKIKIYMDSVLIKTKSIGNDPYSNTSSLPTFDEWINLGRPNAGTHNVYIEFTGNENYIASPINTTLTVNKANTGLNIETTAITYGQTATVNVNIYSETNVSVNGDIIIEIGNNSYDCTITNGNGHVEIPDLNAGTYTVTATYNGDSNFNGTSADTMVTVMPVGTTINYGFNQDSYKYGEDVMIAIDISDAEGTVNIYVDGKLSATKEIENVPSSNMSSTNATMPIIMEWINLGRPNAGTHNVRIEFTGNENYIANPINTTLTVNKANTALDIETTAITYGQTATVNVNIYSETNVSVENATITIEIDNQTTDCIITDGKCSVEIPNLNAGNNTVTVSYNGDTNFNGCLDTATIEVNPSDSEIYVNDVVMTYGESTTISVNATYATGITAQINNKAISVNGFDIIISNIEAGTYTLTVTTIPDGNHKAATRNAIVTVNKASPTIGVEFDSASYQYLDEVKIKVDLDEATGTVEIYVDGKLNAIKTIGNVPSSNMSIGPTSSNTTSSLKWDDLFSNMSSTTSGNWINLGKLGVGQHTITVNYSGNGNYLADSKSVSLTVAKSSSNPTISMTGISEQYGKTVSIPNLLGSDVSASVVGYDANIMIANTSISVSGLGVGDYTIRITTAADPNFTLKTELVNFTILPADPEMDISYNENLEEGESLIVNVNLPNDATGLLILDEVNDTATVSNGKATFNVTELNAGTYALTVFYLGDSNYNSAYEIINVTVTLKSPKTFTYLSNKIANAGNFLELDVDYINSESGFSNGIEITKTITIDGKGHTIDANMMSRVFNVKTGTVTLKNIVFKNGYNTNGGALYGDNAYGIISNCTFIDCTASENGGAINWAQNKGNVSDSTFINCHAKNGGAIYYRTSSSGIISNCIFINCSATNDGGGIDYTTGSQGSVSDSSFTNCSAKTGGAIYWNGNAGTVENSTFINSTAENGDAIFANNELRILGSEFKSRSSANDRNTVAGGVVEDCTLNGNELVKTSPELTLSAPDIEYGETATVIARLVDDAANNVTFTLLKNNAVVATKTSAVSKGTAKWEIQNLLIGVYTVIASYEGDFNYLEESASAVMIVGPQVEIQQNVPAGSEVRVLMDFGEKINDELTIKVDGRTADVLEIKDGKVNQTIKTTRYKIGNHKVTFSYEWDEFDGNVLNYFDTQTNSFKPREHDMVLADEEIVVEEDMNTKDDGVLTMEFPVDATGSLTVLIDGEPVESMDLQEEIEKAIQEYIDETGKTAVDLTTCILKIDLSKYGKGQHTITFEYSGDDSYQAFVKERNVTVNKKVDVIASNMNTVYTAGPTYTIKVYEANAPANKAAVTIKMNGKTYTTLYTASNGVASFKVAQTPGTYKLTITSLGKTITRTLTVKHVVTLKTVTVKKSAKKLVLQATLSKVNGKYLKNKKVTFKFNGKTYTAKTNKKGVAKVTVKSSVLKKLKVGKKVTYQATYIKDAVKKTSKVKK